MVTALHNQTIYRRRSKQPSVKIRSMSGKKGKKVRLLPLLFVFTIILLLSSSVAFSLAMLNTDEVQRKLSETGMTTPLPAMIPLVEETVAESAITLAAALLPGLPAAVSRAGIEIEANPVNSNWQEEPDIPDVYSVQPGDTIYDIAGKYNLSIYKLILANKIADPTRLQVNDQLVLIPAAESGRGLNPASPLRQTSPFPAQIKIEASALSGTVPLTVRFKLQSKPERSSLLYIWDFGNDRFAFSSEAEITYNSPGEYYAFLMVSDHENNEVFSDKLLIKVTPAYNNTRKAVQAEEQGIHYLTASQINDVLDLSRFFQKQGTEVLFKPGETELWQSSPLLKQLEVNKFLIVNTGYARVTFASAGHTLQTSLFVSPFPSRHVFEPDYNWYKTQYNTGFNGNCGPACVAMAIYWAKAEDVSVRSIRNRIGMPAKSGAISFEHMFGAFKAHKTNAFFTDVKSGADLRKIIDRGNLGIIVFYTGKISKASGNPAVNLTGRYYADTTGHYAVIKGYTLDHKYFIVYDPIPADWEANTIRYADGTSMLGKNRHYPAEQVMHALRRNQVIEVTRG